MKGNNLKAIMYKQIVDIIKNKMTILMMFMYPVLLLAFYIIMNDNNVDVLNFIFPTFVTMHIIMSPIICFSSVISEEKEKNTLRVLFISNINAFEYLFGIGICLICSLLISTIPYYFLLDCSLKQSAILFVCSLSGFICSAILGALIGVFSKNQISVGTVASPISMVIGLLPMMSNFNSDIKKISDCLYSQRIYNVIYNFRVSDSIVDDTDVLVFLVNTIVLLILFGIIYKKNGLRIEN